MVDPYDLEVIIVQLYLVNDWVGAGEALLAMSCGTSPLSTGEGWQGHHHSFSYSSVKWSPLAVFIGSDVTPILTLDLTSIGKVEKLISLLIFRVDVPTLFQFKLHL